jgi:hypothetical protein
MVLLLIFDKHLVFRVLSWSTLNCQAGHLLFRHRYCQKHYCGSTINLISLPRKNTIGETRIEIRLELSNATGRSSLPGLQVPVFTQGVPALKDIRLFLMV